MSNIAPRNEWPSILSHALRDAPIIRAKVGTLAAGVYSIKGNLKFFPPHVSADDLLAACSADLIEGDLGDLACLDLATLAQPLLDGCDELHAAIEFPIRWVWTRDCPLKGGAIVYGSCKPMGAKERLTWPEHPAPFWTVSIALGAWLLATPMERLRLLHHELAHCAVKETEDKEGVVTYSPGTNPHDMEENLSTIARFGIRDQHHARVVAAAIAHPTTPERLRTWDVDPKTGQGRLWPAPFTQSMTTDATIEQ